MQWAIRPLKRYADFSGRASRAEFWWFFLFMTIIYVVMWFVMMGMVAGSVAATETGPSMGMLGALGVAGIFMLLFWLALLIPTIAVQTRRLHDTNRSGWWLGAFYLLYAVYLVAIMSIAFSAAAVADPAQGGMAMFAVVGVIGLATMVYMIVLLVFYILPGTRGANKYGADPHGADVAEVFA